MKIYLIGYPGSQKIRKVSEYLTKKYLPFPVKYINYKYDIKDWSQSIADLLKKIDDKYIIMALDDYLLNSPLDAEAVHNILIEMNGINVCAKLCDCSMQDNLDYPVTTQYCIWDREYLITLLERTNTPWDFEMTGSRLFKQDGKELLHRPLLHYFTNSSMSSRWEGVRLDGVSDEDIKLIQIMI